MHPDKETIVSNLNQKLNASPFLFVTDYTGLKVDQFAPRLGPPADMGLPRWWIGRGSGHHHLDRAGLVFIAQGGHVMKAWLNERAVGNRGRLERLDRMANREDGVLHRAGSGLHIALATVVLVLGLFHVLGVLYF